MIFRAYDIRGTVGKDLTPRIAESIGQAFGSEMVERGQEWVIAGRDNRPSSPELAEAFMKGARMAGLSTFDIGEVATPVLYHASVIRDHLPAVMVTGSHLPPDQNGFKLTLGLTPFFGDEIQALKRRIERSQFRYGRGDISSEPDAVARYLADLSGQFTPSGRMLKIVVDAGNGMAGNIAPILLRYMGHQVTELYCTSDGTYPNHPADPFEEENLHDLRATVMRTGADLGLAFDGDADRLGVVDGEGNSHAVDRFLIPVIYDLLKRQLGATIITDPLVSEVLIATIRALGGVPLMWKSGHSHIKQKMKEVGAPFALETSGHIFFADTYYGYDDGIYTALRLVELLGRPNTAPLARIMAEVPRLFTTPQYRPRCDESLKQTVIDAVAAHFAASDINRVDGVRVALPDGWFIIRASNTEARLSLRFEASTEAALDHIRAEVAGVLAGFNIHLI